MTHMKLPQNISVWLKTLILAPFLSLPSLKMTALSYSATTCECINNIFLSNNSCTERRSKNDKSCSCCCCCGGDQFEINKNSLCCSNSSSYLPCFFILKPAQLRSINSFRGGILCLFTNTHQPKFSPTNSLWSGIQLGYFISSPFPYECENLVYSAGL